MPVWTDDEQHRSSAVFYLPPPAGDIWILRPGITDYIEYHQGGADEHLTLRNDAFKKAVAHAKEFIHGPDA
jgi:hypothetical protein